MKVLGLARHENDVVAVVATGDGRQIKTQAEMEELPKEALSPGDQMNISATLGRMQTLSEEAIADLQQINSVADFDFPTNEPRTGQMELTVGAPPPTPSGG